jgi:hypothetical protein
VLRPGSTSGSRTPFIIRDPSTTQVWTFFDTTGALNTVAYIRINGNQSATLSDAGAFNISSASGSAISCMLDVVSDVDGPTVVWAANTGGSAYHLQCLDSSVIASAKYVFSILKDGTLSWGAGAQPCRRRYDAHQSGSGGVGRDERVPVPGTIGPNGALDQ